MISRRVPLAWPTRHYPIVYYVADDRDGIKIGTTRQIRIRLHFLDHQFGVRVALLAVEPGGIDVEHQRHEQFAQLGLGYEWFRRGDELMQHIAKLPEYRPKLDNRSGVQIRLDERKTRCRTR